jgi:hypothetical protein
VVTFSSETVRVVCILVASQRASTLQWYCGLSPGR